MKTLLTILVVLFSFTGQVAFGCSCSQPKVKDVLKWADIVFMGVVTKVQHISIHQSKIFGEDRIIVTFTVFGYWKGKVNKTVNVYHLVSCENNFFREGEKFIVYAKKDKAKEWLGDGLQPSLQGTDYPKPEDNILTTGLCTRTNYLTDADKDLKILGKPKVLTK